MNRLITTTLFSTLLAAASAQVPSFTEHGWGSVPQKPDASLLQDNNSIILLRKVTALYDDSGEDVKYHTSFHMQRYLHDAAAVEDFKTIRFGTGSFQQLHYLKARSIAPDGRITELGPDAIKKSEDDSGRENGLYFAFEGLQPGSIIEYAISSQQSSDYRKGYMRFQFDVPVLKTTYDLYGPEDWRFAFKGYNGLPEPALDTTVTGAVRYWLELDNISGLEEESTTYTSAHAMYLVKKLDQLPEKEIYDITNYRTATKDFHKAIYPELSSKTKKELAALLKKMDLGFARDLEDKVRTIDRYLHGNFRMAEGGTREMAELDNILKTGDCSEFGMQRLYVNVLREAGIDHQVVITCDRTESPFDPEFESYEFLEELVVYVPAIDKYVSPTEMGLGVGYLPPEFMGTHALFIRNIDMNGVFTGIGTIKQIPHLQAEATRHDLKIDVALSDDGELATIDVENGLFGYYARYVQNFQQYYPEDQRKELMHGFLGYLMEGAREHDLKVEYAEAKWFGVKPYTMKGKVVTPMFTTSVGDEVMVKVGDLIGPQMEMYQEKQRKLPVNADFNRAYDRKINIKLPSGWKCSDLQPMSLHKTMEVDGKVMAEFKSTAVEKDGVITVDVVEYYRMCDVPVEHYEAYRSVINAAADFNKRTLLIAKN
jgi:hypothetical protein